MAATKWTVIRRDKKTGKILISELISKWTYKTALGIATEGTIKENFDLVCVVESSKIMLNDEKNQKNNEELPIG